MWQSGIKKQNKQSTFKNHRCLLRFFFQYSVSNIEILIIYKITFKNYTRFNKEFCVIFTGLTYILKTKNCAKINSIHIEIFSNNNFLLLIFHNLRHSEIYFPIHITIENLQIKKTKERTQCKWANFTHNFSYHRRHHHHHFSSWT